MANYTITNVKNNSILLTLADGSSRWFPLPVDENNMYPTGEKLTALLDTYAANAVNPPITPVGSNIDEIKALIVGPNAGELSSTIRSRRNSFLEFCDYTTFNDNQLTPELQTAWKEYRQALRDISKQPGFPNNVVWPIPPSPIYTRSGRLISKADGSPATL